MDSVVHFEIPARDERRARRFYEEVFGWKTSLVPELKYTIVQTGPTDSRMMLKKPGMINGGMMKRDSMVKAPLIYMNVKSIDASLKKIRKMGGKMIMPKTRIQGKFYMCRFRDCEGNVMGMVQGKM